VKVFLVVLGILFKELIKMGEEKKVVRQFSYGTQNMARFMAFIAFAAIGYGLFNMFNYIFAPSLSEFSERVILSSTMILSGFVGVIFAVQLLRGLLNITKYFEKKLSRYTANQIMLACGGIICGLVLVLLLNLIFPDQINWALNILLIIIVSFILGRVGGKVVGVKVDSLTMATTSSTKSTPKILDSSVIIDGRLADLIKIGFIDGPIVVPQFVQDEIENLSLNSDELKASRGKRGLEIIKALEEQTLIPFSISYTSLDELKDANEKLIQLCKIMQGKLVTVNSNLSRLAQKSDVATFNVNDLANAIKPVVLPGEKMKIEITKEGKDRRQGVGFTEEGVMVIVEDGLDYMGKKVEITITTCLQTSTGRIIFGKI